jgi:hypothetical protein
MAQQPSPKSGGKVSRRDFIKLMAAAGTVLTFAPFVDWGKFLPNPTGQSKERQKIELPDGSQANVNSFPVNHSEAIIYPKTNDSALNKESFRTWQFIRLPEELGGKKNDYLPLGYTAWFVFIFGVSGNIGHKKEEKEVNVHVTEACMMLLLVKHLQVLLRCRLLLTTYYLD